MEEEKKEEIEVISEEPVQTPPVVEEPVQIAPTPVVEEPVQVAPTLAVEEQVEVTPTPVVEQVVQTAPVIEEPVQIPPVTEQKQEEVTYDRSLYDPDYKEKSGKGIIIIAIIVGIVVILAILAVVLLPIFFKSSVTVNRPKDNVNWQEVGRTESTVDSAY